MPIQQHMPIMRGRPPVLISFTMFVFRPMAAIAHMIKNFESSLIGAKRAGSAPRAVETVVITEAPMK